MNEDEEGTSWKKFWKALKIIAIAVAAVAAVVAVTVLTAGVGTAVLATGATVLTVSSAAVATASVAATVAVTAGIVAGVSSGLEYAGTQYLPYQVHRRNKRKSNKNKHEQGEARRKMDQGGEKKDPRMKYRKGQHGLSFLNNIEEDNAIKKLYRSILWEDFNFDFF